MKDYKGLIKALRYCTNPDIEDCDECPYRPIRGSFGECTDGMITDSADALEELLRTRTDELNAAYRQGYDAANEEQRKGEWVEENGRPLSSQFVCSECHRTAYYPQPTRDKAWRKRCRYAYCPNCGAKMEAQDG